MVLSFSSISLPYVHFLTIVHCKSGALRCLRDKWPWLNAATRGLLFQNSVLGLSARTSLDVCASLQVQNHRCFGRRAVRAQRFISFNFSTCVSRLERYTLIKS